MKLIPFIFICSVSLVSKAIDHTPVKIRVIDIEYDDEVSEMDTLVFTLGSMNQLTFGFLHDSTDLRIWIPDSFKNESGGADTIIEEIDKDDLNYHRTISKLYNSKGYLIEFYNGNCLYCNFTGTREYYVYSKDKIGTLLYDNLSSNTRRIVEISYNSDNSIKQIIVYKEYSSKSINQFSNLFGQPEYKVETGYIHRRIEKQLLISSI